MKLVIFDFCETLVNFQTADTFVDFIIKKENYTKYKWINFLSRILYRIRVLALVSKLYPELNPSKRLKLLQIRGISNLKMNQYAEEYYTNYLIKNTIEPLYTLLQTHIQNKDFVIIISGGYTPYLKVFAEKHQIKAYFGTQIAVKENHVTGSFLGKDCLYGQKVVLLENYLKENKLNYETSISYSDSSSDLPLLKWTDEAAVVSKNKSQSWAKTYRFKEIIHQ